MSSSHVNTWSGPRQFGVVLGKVFFFVVCFGTLEKCQNVRQHSDWLGLFFNFAEDLVTLFWDDDDSTR